MSDVLLPQQRKSFDILFPKWCHDNSITVLPDDPLYLEMVQAYKTLCSRSINIANIPTASFSKLHILRHCERLGLSMTPNDLSFFIYSRGLLHSDTTWAILSFNERLLRERVLTCLKDNPFVSYGTEQEPGRVADLEISTVSAATQSATFRLFTDVYAQLSGPSLRLPRLTPGSSSGSFNWRNSKSSSAGPVSRFSSPGPIGSTRASSISPDAASPDATSPVGHGEPSLPPTPSSTSPQASASAPMADREDAELKFSAYLRDPGASPANRNDLGAHVPPEVTARFKAKLTQLQERVLHSESCDKRSCDNIWYFDPNPDVKFEDYALGAGSEAQVFLGQMQTDETGAVPPDWVAVKVYDLRKINFRDQDFNSVNQLQAAGRGTAGGLLKYHRRFDRRDQRVGVLVMDLADYSLADRLATDVPIDDKELFCIATQLCRVVQMSHTAPRAVIHGDIRTSNVLVRHGSLYLADWGFSRVLEPTMNTHHTGPSHAPTLLQPPEVVEALDKSKPSGRGAASSPVPLRKAGDIFMLGATLFCVATQGQYPFGASGLVDEHPSCMRNSNEQARLEKIRDPILRDLLGWMLQRDHTRRPSIDLVVNHPYFLDHANRELHIHNLRILFPRSLQEQQSMDPVRLQMRSVMFDEKDPELVRGLQTWRQSFPRQLRPLITNVDYDSGTIVDLVACSRHGLQHLLQELNKRQLNIPSVLQESERRWSSVNEFFFNHSSIAWFLPYVYRRRVILQENLERGQRISQVLAGDQELSLDEEDPEYDGPEAEKE